MIKVCANCCFYTTDEDENGELTEFHHDKNKDEGFCGIRDLFYTVKKDTKACDDFIKDKEYV